MTTVDDSRRMDVVVVNLTVVMRRGGTEDNGPAQAVSAVCRAAGDELSGFLVSAREFAGRRSTDYEVTVTGVEVAADWQRRRVFEQLCLDQDGRPIRDDAPG